MYVYKLFLLSVLFSLTLQILKIKQRNLQEDIKTLYKSVMSLKVTDVQNTFYQRPYAA